MYIRRTIALALLALSCRTEAYAAPKKVSPADEAKAVTSITKDLLNKQKNAALSYRKVYQDILADPARYEAIRTTLQSDLEAAQAAKETRSSELLQALQEKTEVELLQLIVPHIVPFNEGLLALVTIYKGQACAPGGNPAACIGSTWNRRRIAMGAIIDSQAADLKALEAFATSSSQIIYSLITQLQLIGSDAPSDLLDFGLPHYQNNLNVTLQTLVDTTADIAPFFDGKDLDGQPSPRELPCLIGISVPLNNFKDELLAIKSAASGFSGNHDGFLEYLQGASEIYDGSSHGPGVIDHWHGCIDSKQLQINTLQVSLSQARAAGDMNSAANFESTINTLQQDIAKLDAESKILELRRDQITAILNSQATL
ncbi:MAG: hypothetical protein J0M12_14430, partial [Deltaproteobacteria bacterium]|nr:hypothetical protein [Deltaproteobacteria bacterium]